MLGIYFSPESSASALTQRKSKGVMNCISIDWDFSDKVDVEDESISISLEASVRCHIHSSCGTSSGDSGITLNTCLEAFGAPEMMEGGEQVYCSSCKTHQNFVKTIQLYKLPEVYQTIYISYLCCLFNFHFLFFNDTRYL
jgi:hypothetical protein